MGRWVWLYPIALAVHIAEEFAAGGGYIGWLAGEGGAELSQAFFLLSTGLGVLLMAWAAARFRRDERFRWPLLTLAFFYIVNSAAHLTECLLTGSYSPGSWSGALLWVPLAVFTIHRLRQPGQDAPNWRWALAVALLAQAVLTLSPWHPLAV